MAYEMSPDVKALFKEIDNRIEAINKAVENGILKESVKSIGFYNMAENIKNGNTVFKDEKMATEKLIDLLRLDTATVEGMQEWYENNRKATIAEMKFAGFDEEELSEYSDDRLSKYWTAVKKIENLGYDSNQAQSILNGLAEYNNKTAIGITNTVLRYSKKRVKNLIEELFDNI